MSKAFVCLAIETATAMSTVALCRDDTQLEIALSGSRPGAGEIYGAIDQLFTDAAVDKSELNCIAFGCGPGSFTGVRIAAAVTQGLAFGLNIPVARVSSLALLAAPLVREHPDAVIACALDAKQNEAYAGFYGAGDGGLPVSLMSDALIPPSPVFVDQLAPDDKFVLAGNGWSEYAELSAAIEDRVVAKLPDALPRAAELFKFAKQQHSDNALTDAVSAQPNYLRDKVWD